MADTVSELFGQIFTLMIHFHPLLSISLLERLLAQNITSVTYVWSSSANRRWGDIVNDEKCVKCEEEKNLWKAKLEMLSLAFSDKKVKTLPLPVFNFPPGEIDENTF